MHYTVKKSRKARKYKTSANGDLVTFDEFYERIDEKTKADLLDGKIIRDSPAIPIHTLIVTWISGLLSTFTQEFDLGVVFGATATVRLSIYNAPEPDVLFINKKRLGVMLEKYVDGPPDLCVEVISKSSRKYDRGRKFVLYAEHGVKEYWIIDPLKNSVEWFENRNGEFIQIQPDAQGRLHSKVLSGFWLKPEWLVSYSLPTFKDVMQEIVGNV